MVVSVSAGILGRNESWLVLGRETCLPELFRCVVLVCFPPWGFLVISDSSLCTSLHACALPVIPHGCTGGMGTLVCQCHEL